jgi:PadR family transcriptional regulator PadR
MPRMTLATKLVLRVLLDAPGEMYGREVGVHAGLPSGTVQPILARLEESGWAESRREDADAHTIGRPVRRYWQLTPKGVTIASYVATISNETEIK